MQRNARNMDPALQGAVGRNWLVIGAALILMGLLAATAHAQQAPPRTSGFFIGVHFADASWTPKVTTGDGEEVRGEGERGLGFGMSAGYGVTPRLTVYLSGEGAWVEPAGGGDRYTFAHGDFGVRYTVGTWAVRPYLDLAVGGRTAKVETEEGRVDVRGGGISFGAGIRYFVSPAVALNGRIQRAVGDLHAFSDDSVDLDVDVPATPSTRINVGIDWYPRW